MKKVLAAIVTLALIVPYSPAQNAAPVSDAADVHNPQDVAATSADVYTSQDTAPKLLAKQPAPGRPCGQELLSGTPNGIFVESAKNYDDATMQQQLELNTSRLSVLSGIDQASLISHLGNVSGMNQSFSSASLNIQGPGTSAQTVTAVIPNTQTVQTNTVSNGAAAASNGQSVPVSNNQTVNQTTSNPATNQTVTATPSFAPPASTPAAAAPAVTTGYSVQSSAVLSEQMQLTSSLSTELLQEEGALSDRMMWFQDSGGWHLEMRPHTTVGFDVTVEPTEAQHDAAAVVEMIVTSCQKLEPNPEAPAITALIPNEKTFNVAAIRNNSTSLGAGIATQFVGASGGFLFGHNSYFLVQDQDTLAQVFQPSLEDQVRFCEPFKCIGVRWMFRPVLGKRFVGPQRRKIIVQIAFPVVGNPPQYGQAIIHTSWRHFDRNNGLIGKRLDHQTDNLYSYPILSYPLNQVKPVLRAASVEDLGNGQVMVHIVGSFMGGTYVRVGSSLFVDPPSGLVREPASLRFVASASDLLSKNAFLVSKSGEDTPLTIQRGRQVWAGKDAVSVTALDSTYSHVTVSYCEIPSALQDPLNPDPSPMMLLIAGKGYGLSDAPLDREPPPGYSLKCDRPPISGGTTIPDKAVKRVLGLTISTATLMASPIITVKPLFGELSDSFQLPLIQEQAISPLSQAERLVLLKQSKDGAEFLLYGSRLNAVRQVDPTVKLESIGGANAEPQAQDNIRYVSLTAQQVQQYKFLVITRSAEAPEAIAIPAVTLPKTKSATAPTVTGAVLKDDDTAVVTGTGLADLQKVEFKGAEINFTKAKDAKSVTLLNLRAAGVTTTATVQSLDFYFKAKPTSVKVDVFTQKVQTVPK